MKDIQLKLNEEENNLKIKMTKEIEILKKKLSHRKKEINSIQKQEIKLNIQKGKEFSQLMRDRFQSKEANEIISKSKGVQNNYFKKVLQHLNFLQ